MTNSGTRLLATAEFTLSAVPLSPPLNVGPTYLPNGSGIKNTL